MKQEASSSGSKIALHVQFFASTREVTGVSQLQLELAAGSTCAALKAQLEASYPALQFAKNQIRLAVNKRYSEDGRVLQDGDSIALIPPISGG